MHARSSRYHEVHARWLRVVFVVHRLYLLALGYR
jgi:hypothetical protein